MGKVRISSNSSSLIGVHEQSNLESAVSCTRIDDIRQSSICFVSKAVAFFEVLSDVPYMVVT